MPQLPANVPLYEPNQPYYYTYDNIPIQALVQRDDIINTQVDINTTQLENAAGDAGTLANRLNQSTNSLGQLQELAINTAMHNIGYHTDGEGPDNVQYVRMQYDERTKLATVADSATNFGVSINTGSSAGGSGILTIEYDQGFLSFQPSSTISWSVANNQQVMAHVNALPSSHQHYNNVVPVSAYTTSDYKTYLTGISSSFLDSSLQVYINGHRIFPNVAVNNPTSNPLVWSSNYFVPNTNGLGFVLDTAITSLDVIFIDFITEA